MVSRAGRLQVISRMIWLLLLATCFSGNAWATSVLGTWRNEVNVVRLQAENDAPAAYQAAQHLQATLPQAATPADQSKILNLLARIEVYLGMTDKSALHARLAFDLARQHGDKVGLAEADLNVAINAVNQGDLDAMNQAVTHSMVVLEGQDQPALLAEAMLRAVMMYRRMQHLDESVAMAVQALEIAKRSRDPLALTYAYRGMALVYEESERLEDVQGYYQQMQDQAVAAHYRSLQAEALLGLGSIYSRLGDAVRAERLQRQAIQEFRQVGMPFKVGHGLFTLAETLHKQGRFPESLQALDEAMGIYESRSNKIGMWGVLNARSETLLAQGKTAASNDDIQRAYQLAKDIGFPRYQSESAQRLAAVAHAMGNDAHAYALSVEALTGAERATSENVSKRLPELARHYEEVSRRQQVDQLKLRDEMQTAELQRQSLRQRLLAAIAIGSLTVLTVTALLLFRLRRAHQRLAQSESNQQAILNAMPDLMFELGLDGRYYACHTSHPELLAAPVEELLQKTIADFLPPDALEVGMAALQEAHERGVSIGRQYTLDLPDGTHWFEYSVAQKPVSKGEVPRFIVLSRDITERKKLEEDLRVREQYQRALLDNFPFMVWLKDTESRLLAVNRPYLEAAGLSPDAPYFGLTDLDLFPAENAEQYRADDREVMQSGQRKTVEEWIGTPGAMRWHETSKNPVWDSTGQLLGTVGYARDITEQKEAERLLHEQEQAIRAVVENSPDYIVRYDTECRRVYMNPTMQRGFKLPVDQLLGASPAEYSTLPEEYLDKIRLVLKSGQEQRIELPYAGLQGETRWVDARLEPEFDLDGKVVSVLAVGRDITERKEAENALKESEQRYREIFENVSDSLYLVEVLPDGRLRNLAFNPVFEKSTGISRDILIGTIVGEAAAKGLMSQELTNIAAEKYRQVLQTGKTVEGEVLLHLPNGLRYYHSTFVPLRDAAGEIRRILVLGRDITEIRRAEREFRTLAENAPDNIARYDRQSRVVYVNPQLAKTLGIPAETLMGQTPKEAFNPLHADYEAFQAAITRALETGQAGEIELRFTREGGDSFYHHIRIVAEYDEAGQISGALAIGRDITEHRHVERLLLNLSDSISGVLGALRQMPDGSSYYEYASKGLYELFGIDLETAMQDANQRFKRMVPEDLAVARERMRDAVQRMVPLDIEYRVNHPDRGQIWVETRISPVREDDGSIMWYGYSYEVTDRRMLQEALAEREREFHSLADNLPDVIARYDRESRLVYCNPRMQEIISQPLEVAMGKTPSELNASEVIRQYQHKIEAVTQTEQPDEMMLAIPSRPGVRRVYDHVRFVPEFDAEGRVSSVLVVGHDLAEITEIQRQLQTLLENLPDFVLRLDAQGRHLYLSASVYKAYGPRAAEAIGKTAVEYGMTGDPASDEKLLQATLDCLHGGSPIMMEMTFRHPSGDRVFDVLHVPEWNEFGQVESVLAVARDITERKRAEEAVAQRELEFRTLAENTPDILVRYDLDCRRIYFNRAYLQSGDVVAAEVAGTTPLEYWSILKPTAEEYVDILREVMRSRQPTELTFEQKDQDGQPIYQAVSLVPEFDQAGNVIGVLGISRDITSIKRMEALLRKSEQEFRTLAENSPEMIVRYDRECRRIYINPAYEKQTGIPRERALNKTPDEVWKPQTSREDYKARLQRVMDTGRPENIMLEWVGDDGEPVSHSMHAVAEYDAEGNVTGTLVIGHNVSELIATERRLKESRAKLRAMTAQREVAREEERKRIAREIHDELGQLLSVLRLNVTTLDYCFGAENSDLHDKAGKMVQTVDRAILMVRNLATRLRPAVLDAGIGLALEWMVREFSESTGVACHLHLPNEDVTMDADRAIVVFRIAQESLTNALRHSGATRIDVSLSQQNETYDVIVRDNGKGFDMGANRRKNAFGIVGMQERALMLGGELEVSSAPGEGTMIHLRIPVASPPAPADKQNNDLGE